jgi:hypothetical protein
VGPRLFARPMFFQKGTQNAPVIFKALVVLPRWAHECSNTAITITFASLTRDDSCFRTRVEYYRLDRNTFALVDDSRCQNVVRRSAAASMSELGQKQTSRSRLDGSINELFSA